MNDENLIPNSERTPSERRANARKAGIASGKARRDKRNFRETLTQLLQMPMVDKDGKPVVSPVTGRPMSVRETMTTATIQAAIKGNVKAFSAILDVLGEKVIKVEAETTVRNKRTIEEIDEGIAHLKKIDKMADGEE